MQLKNKKKTQTNYTVGIKIIAIPFLIDRFKFAAKLRDYYCDSVRHVHVSASIKSNTAPSYNALSVNLKPLPLVDEKPRRV